MIDLHIEHKMADDRVEAEKKPRKSRRFFSLYIRETQKTEQSDNDDNTSVRSSESNGFSLMLKMTDLPDEVEPFVRKSLFTKLAKGSLYSDTGCISVVENGSLEDSEELSCYFLESRQPDRNIINIGEGDSDTTSPDKYIVCFLSSNDNILDQQELDEYASGLLRVLEQNNEVEIKRYLQNWSQEATEYVCRCVAMMQENIKYLINAALVDAKVVINGGSDEIKRDIQKFVKSCNMADILRQMDGQGREASPLSGSMDMLIDLVDTKITEPKTTVTVEIDGDSVKVSPEVCTKFCEDWGSLLCKANMENAGQMRQIVESGKMKYIQSINTLKRLLMLAENDFYALYRAYVYLKNSGNCDILLHSAYLDSIPEVCNVFKCLMEFIQENEVVKENKATEQLIEA